MALQGASESPREHMKTEIIGLLLQNFEFIGLGGVLEIAGLTRYQMMSMILAQGPLFENQMMKTTQSTANFVFRMQGEVTQNYLRVKIQLVKLVRKCVTDMETTKSSQRGKFASSTKLDYQKKIVTQKVET